jgi:hypothetical protein
VNPDDLTFDRPEGMDLDTWESIKREVVAFIGDRIAEVLTRS